jgi:hypothetical protein
LGLNIRFNKINQDKRRTHSLAQQFNLDNPSKNLSVRGRCAMPHQHKELFS